jgi:hypothetical protein
MTWMTRGASILGLILAMALLATDAAAQTARDDEAGVRAAVLDYVDAIYEVEPDRIERSVSKDLVKRGYWRESPDAAYEEFPMTYEQLHQLASHWNADGHLDTSTAVKEIVVLDVLDKTASAKLVADWGVDYMHLAKVDGRWMIKNIIWQSPPRS